MTDANEDLVIAWARRVVAVHNSRPPAWAPAAATDAWHGDLAQAVGELERSLQEGAK